jgi:hypothetical protein
MPQLAIAFEIEAEVGKLGYYFELKKIASMDSRIIADCSYTHSIFRILQCRMRRASALEENCKNHWRWILRMFQAPVYFPTASMLMN